MSNLRKYYDRGRNPKGFWGLRALKNMNGKHHAAMPEWALEELQIPDRAEMLDVGCGGGANIARLLSKCPRGHVTGLDMSQLSLEVSQDTNNNAIVDHYCTIVGGNASQMPLARNIFDLATAFETIYYWPTIESGFSEMFRVIKSGGVVLIANERDGLTEEDLRLSRDVAGMRIYTAQEIEQALSHAGFTDITTKHDEQRHYICVTARKP